MTTARAALLAAALLCLAPGPASAMKPAGGVQKLAGAADVVARGRVQQVVSRWTADRSAIYTEVRLAVDRFARNRQAGSGNRNIKILPMAGRGEVVFRLLGGVVGDIAMTAADMEIPAVGQELIVLLQPAAAAAGLAADADTLAPIEWFPVRGGRVALDGHEIAADELMTMLAGTGQP